MKEKKPILQNTITFPLERGEGNHLATLHRNELRPAVRSYADNLHAQIVNSFEKKDIRSFEQMNKMTLDGRLSLEELEKISHLMEKLASISKTGNIPSEDQNEAIESITEKLEPLVKEYVEYLEIPFDLIIPGGTDSFLKKQIELLPVVPYEILVENPFVHQVILKKVFELLPNAHKKNSGKLVSFILNYNLEKLTPAQKKEICQKFDLTNFSGTGYLGSELNGGKIIILGKAGDFIAADMIDGEVVLEKSRHLLGYRMKNGKIIAGVTADGCGYRMTGGEIQLGKALRLLGESMVGGIIKVKHAGEAIGKNTRGGTIFIEKDYTAISESRKGGKIYFKGEEISN